MFTSLQKNVLKEANLWMCEWNESYGMRIYQCKIFDKWKIQKLDFFIIDKSNKFVTCYRNKKRQLSVPFFNTLSRPMVLAQSWWHVHCVENVKNSWNITEGQNTFKTSRPVYLGLWRNDKKILSSCRLQHFKNSRNSKEGQNTLKICHIPNFSYLKI